MWVSSLQGLRHFLVPFTSCQHRYSPSVTLNSAQLMSVQWQDNHPLDQDLPRAGRPWPAPQPPAVLGWSSQEANGWQTDHKSSPLFSNWKLSNIHFVGSDKHNILLDIKCLIRKSLIWQQKKKIQYWCISMHKHFISTRQQNRSTLYVLRRSPEDLRRSCTDPRTQPTLTSVVHFPAQGEWLVKRLSVSLLHASHTTRPRLQLTQPEHTVGKQDSRWARVLAIKNPKSKI